MDTETEPSETALKPTIRRMIDGVKRETNTGRFIDKKANNEPFKGVRKEK